MLVEIPKRAEVVGTLKIWDIQRIIKLDAEDVEGIAIKSVRESQIKEIVEKMAIIIPVKNERLHLLEGVLKAIPYKCPVIVVSNSSRDSQDIFKMEVDVISHFHNLTGHPIYVIHQKDPSLVAAFREVEYHHILDGNSVRDGKAEGMLIGTLIAKALGVSYIGFIDADNYIPGAVNEYVKDYAVCFSLAKSPYCMVRIHWRHKPKIMEERLYFKKWGRVSEITNRYLNALISSLTRFETEIVKTGNAGEHAMSMKLAEIMAFSTGYSVEPYHYIYLLEEFGGNGDGKYPEASSEGVEIYQIETLNPHLHEEKGEEHVHGMLIDSLSTIYHSRIAGDDIREKIVEELGGIPEKRDVLPPIKDVDVGKFLGVLENTSETFLRFEKGTEEHEV
ncbi:MAG: mannosyl-3-phosphoglycerate synthase [Archaeoglobi archaeon]|nr:mannosyl-3-phosphoglycerate synthase [Archaeoglobi archaeon]